MTPTQLRGRDLLEPHVSRISWPAEGGAVFSHLGETALISVSEEALAEVVDACHTQPTLWRLEVPNVTQ